LFQNLHRRRVKRTFFTFWSNSIYKNHYEKNTNESKGIAYIKFTKASSAALSIESAQDSESPYKVMIADAKGSRSSKIQSNEPEDNPPRSRLFVTMSKAPTEEEVTKIFRSFEGFEYCKLVKDRSCSFVKFNKASNAALAMETITTEDPKIRVVIAEPKSKRGRESRPPDHSFGGNRKRSEYQDQEYSDFYSSFQYPSNFPFVYPAYLPRQRLFIVCPKSLTQEQLARVFSRVPGMEYCDLKKDKRTGDSKGFAYVNYSTPQAALLAKDQFDGYEFPGGISIKVTFAEPLGVKGNVPPLEPFMNEPYNQLILNNNAYYSSQAPIEETKFDRKRDRERDQNSPEGSRLFVVFTGKNISNGNLGDIFGQFPGLEYAKLIRDKNYGYVKYTSASSAQLAIQHLNGTEVNNKATRLKVQLASPSGTSRKKQRT